MIYYARSANINGKKETVQHHLVRTAELCEAYTNELGCKAVGTWMGSLHDFGKYSSAFQEVLCGNRCHVDHALPGAAFISAKLCGKASESSPFWPLVVAVRCHHSSLQNALGMELRDWSNGAEISPDGSAYSITADDLRDSVKIFSAEVGLPKTLPQLPTLTFSNHPELRCNQKMLLTRMLYSSLTDADYSASAEHFTPNYLQITSIPSIDPKSAYQMLMDYKTELSKHSTADPAINQLRNDLYAACESAGRTANSGLYTLTAPTGAGKTLAMLAFALQQMIIRNKKRIILVLPYLSIIEQNADVYRHIIPDILEDHSQAERENDNARELSQRWDAPFIITTSVKFFESLFSCTGPACRKLHRLADSVILFDEAQSLPVHLAETTLTAMQELSHTYHSTIVFSTATQPDFDQLPDVSWKPTEIVPDPQSLFSRARRVSAQWHLSCPVSLFDIASDLAEEPNACIIVNLRSHAQKAFDALTEFCDPEDIYLMTTDLCPAHRTVILDEIKRKLKNGQRCYLVATQCIEAGVDISFDVMYRALAPLEGIIQAAGRCNRSDARKRGKFVVFIPDEEHLYPDSFYQQSANAVLTLNARHEIDLNDLSHIREYYSILYGGGQIREKKELTDAIRSMDFPGVARAYRLIESDQLQILVPSPGEEELFRELSEDARTHGVTAPWMRRAAPLTVHSYHLNQVRNTCEPLFVYSGNPREKRDCNWYLLSNPALYDPKKGLQLSAEFNGII